jgi:4-aminobutyrate aminotransferase-like enzyme
MPFPYPYREGDDERYPTEESCLQRIEREIKNSKSTSSEVGTVILEPIQGCGGYVIPPDSFIADLRKICREYDILMVADEEFTGLGRTGKWLAMDHIGVSADIVCVGKTLGGGLPISACISSKEIFEAFKSSSFLALHGSTFSGDPLACACALATINRIEKKGLLASSTKKGQTILDKLESVKQKHTLIGDVRGRGLIVAIELVKNKTTKEPAYKETLSVVNAALCKGVIVLLTRVPFGNVIGLAPPATITDEQIECVVETLDECMFNVSSQEYRRS